MSEGEKARRKRVKNMPTPKERKEKSLGFFRYVSGREGAGLSMPLPRLGEVRVVGDERGEYERRFEQMVGRIRKEREA